MPQRRAAIVTDTYCRTALSETAERRADAAGIDVTSIVVPDGEQHKDWQTLNSIFDALLANRCERKTTLIALGGGVVGDLDRVCRGHLSCAACLSSRCRRRCSRRSIPPSAARPRSIIRCGKNMIGAFYQPQAVIADTATLDTLPARELARGPGRSHQVRPDPRPAVLRMAGRQHVDALERARSAGAGLRDPALLREQGRGRRRGRARGTGERALLNLGHTFGHAIEAGWATAPGCTAKRSPPAWSLAARLSQRIGHADGGRRRHASCRLLERARLPVDAPDLGAGALPRTDGPRQESRRRQTAIRLAARGSGQAFLTVRRRCRKRWTSALESRGQACIELAPYAVGPRNFARTAQSRETPPRRPQRIPARPRPHHSFDRISPARIQDPGLRQSRRRPVSHAADAQPRSRADRAIGGAQPASSTKTWSRPFRLRTTSGTRRSVTPDRMRCNDCMKPITAVSNTICSRCAWSICWNNATPRSTDSTCASRPAKASSSTARSRMRACWATSASASSDAGGRRWKRSSPIWPTKSPTTITTSTTACARAC